MNIDTLLNEYNQKILINKDLRNHLHNVIFNVTQRNDQAIDIISRVKTWESISHKALLLEVNSLSEINDLVGVRVVVNNEENLISVFERIAEEFQVVSKDIYKSELLGEPRYQRIHLIISVNDKLAHIKRWEPFKGLKAEIQIKTSFAESWDEIKHYVGFNASKDYPFSHTLYSVIQAIDGLSQKINEFELLLKKPDIHEKKDIHPFLLENPFILHPNPEDSWSEVPIGLGREYQMDFMFREADGEYVIVEIENSKHKLFNKNGDFSAPLNHAQRQVEDWQDWIDDNLSTVQKKYPGIISPRGLVIIGRSKDLSDVEKRKLQRRNINLRGRLKVITYDELIANATAYVNSIKKHLQK